MAKEIDTTAKENAALRTRLNRIEGTRATSTAHVAATSAAAVSAKQEPSNVMAASYPVKAVPAVAPPPPLWNWTRVSTWAVTWGAGLSRNQLSEGACTPNFFGLCRTLGSSIDLGSDNGLGILGGVQVGYNWQFSNSPVVIGIEGTYSFADLKGDHQNSVSLIIPTNFDDADVGQERFEPDQGYCRDCRSPRHCLGPAGPDAVVRERRRCLGKHKAFGKWKSQFKFFSLIYIPSSPRSTVRLNAGAGRWAPALNLACLTIGRPK